MIIKNFFIFVLINNILFYKYGYNYDNFHFKKDDISIINHKKTQLIKIHYIYKNVKSLIFFFILFFSFIEYLIRKKIKNNKKYIIIIFIINILIPIIFYCFLLSKKIKIFNLKILKNLFIFKLLLNINNLSYLLIFYKMKKLYILWFFIYIYFVIIFIDFLSNGTKIILEKTKNIKIINNNILVNLSFPIQETVFNNLIKEKKIKLIK